MLVRHGRKQGNSLIYHSPLNSPMLREEIGNFNKLLTRFANGEFDKLLLEYVDKSMGWEFCKEVVIDNERLRLNKSGEKDSLYFETVDLIKKSGTVSVPKIMRHFEIGYARAKRLIERLEDEKIVKPVNNDTGPREVLIEHANDDSVWKNPAGR
jgi:S-DNA-T family DNA segregation ATPase FtsK/SpoIIIE